MPLPYVKLDLVTGDVFTQARVRYMETQYELAVAMAGVGVHELYLPAAAFRPIPGDTIDPLQNYATKLVAAWPFNNAPNTQKLITTLALPKQWNNSTLTAQVYWFNLAGGAGDVAWFVNGRAMGDGEAMGSGGTGGTSVEINDTALAADLLAVTPVSGAFTLGATSGIAVGDLVNLFITRDSVGHAPDTYNQIIYLVGVKFRVTTDKATDD